MYINVDESRFVESFDKMGRAENFSIAARRTLFDWFEQMEEGMGESIQLDPIAICCDWSELDADELVKEYGHLVDSDEYEDDDEQYDLILERVQDETATLVVEHIGEEDTILVMEF